MNIPGLRHFLPCLVALAGLAQSLAADLPSAEEYRGNWPRFRGPQGDGVSPQSNPPVTCDVPAGTNVAWSVEVPAEGFSSPVIWGDRVFLSGGDEMKREVMCFDAASGKLLWARPVPKNPYGHAASLLTWQGRVIVQFDQGEPDDKISQLYAFDSATGAVVWQQARPVGASWSTPIVIDAAGQSQIITTAVPLVIAYAAKDGAELWRADCLDGLVTPSPIFVSGTLFVINPSNKLQTIRPNGHGDVTKTHLGWSVEDGIPDVTSPVSNGEVLFLLDSSGVLSCYDAKTGKKQWDHDYSDECNASPSLAGNRVYLVTKKGTLAVVAAARQFEELGQSPLGEQVFATPAFAENKIFIRGVKHLICIAAKGAVAKP